MCSYEARKDMFMIKSHSCMTVASSTDASFLSCSLAEASPIKIKKNFSVVIQYLHVARTVCEILKLVQINYTCQCVVVLAGNMDYVTMQQAVGNSKNH